MRTRLLIAGLFCTVLSLTIALAADPTMPPPPATAPAPASAATAAPDQATPPQPQTLKVEDCVTLALKINPTIIKAEEDLGIAQTQVTGAKADALPTVTATATKYHEFQSTSITIPTIGTISFAPSDTVTITAQQPIWPETRWKAPLAVARANEGAQSEELRRTEQQVAYQVREAFYELLGAQDLLDVANSTLTVAQEQLKLAESTVKAGTAPMLDEYQAQATLDDAQVGVAKVQNNVDLAGAALAVQIGLPADTPMTIVGPATEPAVPDKVEPLVEQALKSRPEILQIKDRRDQAKAAVDAARISSLPVLSLGAEYNQPLNGNTLTSSQGITLTAVLTYSLYNGGAAKAGISAAEQQLAELDATEQQTELGIGLDVRQGWLNLQNASKQLSAATDQQKAATEALRIAELRYREGEGILLEVEQARLQLTQAETALAQARFQAHTASAQLDYAIGAEFTPAGA